MVCIRDNHSYMSDLPILVHIIVTKIFNTSGLTLELFLIYQEQYIERPVKFNVD